MSKFLHLFIVSFAILSLSGCVSAKKAPIVFSQNDTIWSSSTSYTVNGEKICKNNLMCSDDELPPHRPCNIPMPTHYDNINLSEGDILLIQPYTRNIVICYERPNLSAYGCAEKFQKEGFTLITDVPQIPAKYDTIVEGNYPSRKWGANKNQTSPRW